MIKKSSTVDMKVGPSSEGIWYSKCGKALKSLNSAKRQLNFNAINNYDDEQENCADEECDEYCSFIPSTKNTSRATNNNKSIRLKLNQMYVFNKPSIDFFRYKYLWCETHNVQVDLYYPSKPENAFHYDRRDYRNVDYKFMTIRGRTNYKCKSYRPMRYIKITLTLFKSIMHRIWNGMF